MDLEQEYIEDAETERLAEEQPVPEESVGGEPSDKIKLHENKYEIVTRTAFLCGVGDNVFNAENSYFLPEVIEQLGKEPKALLIRNLCLIRNSVEHNFKKITDAMKYDGRSFFGLSEYIPVQSLEYVEQQGIHLPISSTMLQDILAEINSAISDRINNCKDIFPTWLNWEYVRELFIMPDGFKPAGMREAADQFYKNMAFYPFGTYINWRPRDVGNLFRNDYAFVKELYEQHGNRFFDTSNLSDVSEDVKNRIYDFLDCSSKTALVVDCENADPYGLCAMFRSLDDSQIDKIDKIILYDDPKASSGWRFFEQHIDVDPGIIEHNHIQRILDHKSLLDVKLSSRVTREHLREKVDSFVLVSSDSDFWGLIEEIPEANFLVMIEHRKSSAELRRVFEEHNVFYCFADDFYTGTYDSLKKQAIFSEINAFLDERKFNARDLLEDVLETTRIEMDQSEKNRFYDKHLKNMTLSVSKDGTASIEIKK